MRGTVSGQLLCLRQKRRMRHNHQVQHGRARRAVERVQVLVGYFAECPHRVVAKVTAGLQGHKLAHRIGRRDEATAGIERHGLGAARVGYVPHHSPGGQAGKHVAVLAAGANVGQRPELQLRAAELEQALGVNLKVIEVAAGAGVVAAIRQPQPQLSTRRTQAQLVGG